jgi:hypothetical protein
MESNCVAGDLAIVINAHHRCNIGRIVKVLAQHDGKGDLVFRDVGVVWLVESPQPMTWTIGKRRIRRKSGPVPDTYLKPIRGNQICRDVASCQHSCQSHGVVEQRAALA